MKPGPYGPFPYRPARRRPPLAWPGGARLALLVVVMIEFCPLDAPIPGGTGRVPDVSAWSKRDYGNRVGIFRLMRLLARHGIRASAALDPAICDQHPALLEALVARGWEFLGHA